MFILTSTFEGLPNVLLETLVLKKFIISSKCQTGPSEILLNGNGGLLFKVKNHKQLAKKIIFYTKNKNKCKKLLQNAVGLFIDLIVKKILKSMKIYLKIFESFIKKLIFNFLNQFKKLINQKIVFPNRVFI